MKSLEKICYNILDQYGFSQNEFNFNDVVRFVSRQIDRLPDYIRVAIKIAPVNITKDIRQFYESLTVFGAWAILEKENDISRGW